MLEAYHARISTLQAEIAKTKPPFRLKKRTTSNLFRYSGRNDQANAISLVDFNHILQLDKKAQTLTVEGLATMEQIVDATLPHGFLPLITPELKHITIGGATVGIGIESTGYRHGFVHDMLLEADVLLSDGRVITCTADNEHEDLFHALPNSYGTFGYVLRAVIKLEPAKPFVQVINTRYNSVTDYLKAFDKTIKDNPTYLEGLFYSKDECYLTQGDFVDHATACFNIFRNPYYKAIRQDATLHLRTKDYIFRYDPDWFWNVPETGFYRFFRAFAPAALRSSKFYNWYCALKNRWLSQKDDGTEQLIQDWEVPWDKAEQLINFALEHVDLEDQPWVALPIKTPKQPTIYPVKANQLYFNLGCYCLTQRPNEHELYYYTKIMDQQCFKLGGLKMLYSSTFIDKAEFDKIYNGQAYCAIKQQYDPQGYLPTLAEKALGS